MQPPSTTQTHPNRTPTGCSKSKAGAVAQASQGWSQAKEKSRLSARRAPSKSKLTLFANETSTAQADPALKASAFKSATWLLSKEEFLARFPVKFLVPATDRGNENRPGL